MLDAIDLRLPKNSIVNDIIEEILKRVTPPSPNSRIRLIKVHQDRIQKDYLGTEPVERIQEHATLYAEEIPQDEIHVDQNNRASYSSISFHKGSDGIPFKFVIKNSETLANTKVCLRHRLGMSEKDFSKVKIAFVSETSYANPEYLDDDEMTLSNEDCLGLDHVDKSGCAESVFIRG